jgi:hypothetical protein
MDGTLDACKQAAMMVLCAWTRRGCTRPGVGWRGCACARAGLAYGADANGREAVAHTCGRIRKAATCHTFVRPLPLAKVGLFIVVLLVFSLPNKKSKSVSVIWSVGFGRPSRVLFRPSRVFFRLSFFAR